MNVRLQHAMRFNAGVYYGNEMRINEYTLKLWMYTNSHNQLDHNTAFERIKYFIYHKLDSTIFISSEDQEQCQLYANAGLDITTMPTDPVDQLVGIMLFYKLNAIIEDRMIIQEVELSSTMGDGMVYLHSENENSTLAEIPSWWNSPDVVHCDLNLLNSDKVVSMHHSSIWRDVDLVWPDIEDNTENENTVVFADFGKDETR